MNRPPLNPALRDALAQRILVALTNAAPGSVAQLRGSLAEGRADAYSDIDVFWEVPDDLFPDCAARIGVILGAVHTLESLRLDRDFQHSDRRRLVFAQFADQPLFWRFDLDIFAQSVNRDLEYDVRNPAARGSDWSAAQSALMNAVAAIKAMLRGQPDTASELLRRGYERVGLALPAVSPPELILDLCKSIAEMDPSQVELAQRVLELHQQVFAHI